MKKADSAPEVESWISCIREVAQQISEQSEDESSENLANSSSESNSLSLSSSGSSHEGYLLKEGNNIVKDWKRRWFILNEDKLTYYNKKGVCISPSLSSPFPSLLSLSFSLSFSLSLSPLPFLLPFLLPLFFPFIYPLSNHLHSLIAFFPLHLHFLPSPASLYYFFLYFILSSWRIFSLNK